MEQGYSGKAYRWNREKYSSKRRFVDIWSFVLTFMFKLWRYNKAWSYPGGVTEAKQAARRYAQAVWVRNTFLDLGPTFIKVGQLFSTRADIFPSEYVDELSKLQDRVPAFDYEQVATIIEQELSKTIAELFASFEPIPLAAASLGQVHKAELHSGETVVVKVQRPGLKKLFEIDLQILKGIAYYFQNHPEWGRGRDWIGIYEECCRILWEEIDYLNEGRNADTFRRNFRSYNWVKVPRVYWRYTTSKIITLEYVPGIKVSQYEALEAAGVDRKAIARYGAQAYLHQLLNNGFFHADPHPGNLAVSPDGALIFYDFGMMGTIKSNVREGLMETLFGIAQKDGDRVVQSLINLGAIAPVEDMGPVRRSVQYMLDNFMDKPFENQSVATISEDLYEIAYNQPFRFPATFTFVMRAFSTLEGVGKGLDPEFNFMEVAQPYAMELMNNNNGASQANTFLNELSRQAVQVSSTALGLPRRLEDTLEKLERGDIRLRVRALETERLLRRQSNIQMGISYALIISAFTISATILLVNRFYWLAAIAGLIVTGISFVFLRLVSRLDRYDQKY
ncbi:AarF/ABC1/UbiB kinase family protein [Cylindrospermopsis raciborskii]|uniref:ABC1 kinase family protein n=1 Tax=Cylindrospermopsis raciborskii TaxID=77022 RepID=UPI000778DC92|nr:AarF/ABC1/UbiB kinase family protein [Cylindrospermopsis raciborskii]MCZ2200972.1 AarF/ABC1/UbiB kinase family protein [Cylindrospermopsis raciborskii PAMP2012]MCZ2206896.1 AarF/ABC1/UbiB kinase family protein [Cylindrospermopsis raciborskii PAMP2011]